MNATESKTFVRAFLDNLFFRGNIEEVLSSFADDGSWWVAGDLPVSGLFVGRQAIYDNMIGGSSKWVEPRSMSVEIKTLMGESDKVAVEWTIQFRTLAGRDYKNDYMVMFELRDGKIQSIREYMDTLYASEVVYSPDSGS